MSSFKRFSTGSSGVCGTRYSLNSGQPIVSSGVASLDAILNGGVPLGSVVIVEEDRCGEYARMLLRYFVAESVVTKHSLFLATLDADAGHLLAQLPSPVDENKMAARSSEVSGEHCDRMKIAWRYQAVASRDHDDDADKPASSCFSRLYDLSRSLPAERVAAAAVCVWQPPAAGDMFRHLLTSCRAHLAGQSAPKRVAVHCLGSPLWGASPDTVIAVCQLLRALARAHSAVVLVTVPSFPAAAATDAPAPAGFWGRLRCAGDICLGLQSFRDTANSGALGDYHGLLLVHRLCSLHELAARQPATVDLAFKARRNKFVIEPFHLPPDLSDSASRV